MRYQKFFLGCLLTGCTMWISGCFSARPEDIKAFEKPTPGLLSVKEYTLNPPDEIQVFSTSIPELDEQRQQIRPDGKVMFELLGEVEAAGKTPSQLAEVLREKAINLYALTGDYPIEVRVVSYKSKNYYVEGQVFFSGPKPITGRDTVLSAVSAARPTNLAWLARIQVVRPSMDPNKRPKIFELNYDKLVAHGDASKNVLLQEGDIVFVPPTVLGAVGLMIGEITGPALRTASMVNVVSGGTTTQY